MTEARVFVLRVYRNDATPQSDVAGVVEAVETERKYAFRRLEELPDILRRALRSKRHRTKAR